MKQIGKGKLFLVLRKPEAQNNVGRFGGGVVWRLGAQGARASLRLFFGIADIELRWRREEK